MFHSAKMQDSKEVPQLNYMSFTNYSDVMDSLLTNLGGSLLVL